MPFGRLSQTRLFFNSQSFLGLCRGGDANACMRECVRENVVVGGVIGNTSRRGESSWLCMKVEFAFFSGYGILIRVLPPSFLESPVTELCLLFIPDPFVNTKYWRLT
jgi:hypothetical protein